MTHSIDHLNSRVQELERIVHALSTSPQSPHRSQRGGTYKLLNEDGREVFYFGNTNSGGFGILGRVPDGAGPGTSPTVLEIDNGGLEAPWLDIPVERTDEFVPVTSGTFATIWRGNGMLVVSNAIKVKGSITCDASTTGEARVVVGSVTSAVVSCPANTQTNYEWNLLLAANSIGVAGLLPKLEVRRVSGTGNVNVFTPRMAQVGNRGSGATATGL